MLQRKKITSLPNEWRNNPFLVILQPLALSLMHIIKLNISISGSLCIDPRRRP